MSKAKKGKKRSVETREKISKEEGEEAQRGDQREDEQGEEGESAENMPSVCGNVDNMSLWPGLGSRSISCCAQINVLYILSTCVQILVSHWSSSLR